MEGWIVSPVSSAECDKLHLSCLSRRARAAHTPPNRYSLVIYHLAGARRNLLSREWSTITHFARGDVATVYRSSQNQPEPLPLVLTSLEPVLSLNLSKRCASSKKGSFDVSLWNVIRIYRQTASSDERVLDTDSAWDPAQCKIGEQSMWQTVHTAIFDVHESKVLMPFEKSLE